MIYGNYGIIIQHHVNYYDFIQFTVCLEADVYTTITLRVGEAIDVERC
jgi:hypothetical protein